MNIRVPMLATEVLSDMNGKWEHERLSGRGRTSHWGSMAPAKAVRRERGVKSVVSNGGDEKSHLTQISSDSSAEEEVGATANGKVKAVPAGKNSFSIEPKPRPSEYQNLPAVHNVAVTYFTMLALLALCPPAVISLWYTIDHLDGSLSSLFHLMRNHGAYETVLKMWPWPTYVAVCLILGFAAFEAVLLLILPGGRFLGPVSPAGYRPVYKDNGLLAYAVTMATYVLIWKMGWFNPDIVYDHLGEIFSTLIVGSFFFCVLLYIKGHVAPSSADWGSSGNIVVDFFWGMELYPRIGKHFDIKVFTNCRFGMMGWAVLVLTYCIKQHTIYGHISDSMLVSAGLMLVYITKFFVWETGYFGSMDIAHDRAGFYICWGCLVWVPSVYTSPAMYLVKHPVVLGYPYNWAIFLAGCLCIYINYDCDRQRQEFRKTNGKCKIWGKAPTKITATYVTERGETKSSLLLTSGWWGVARHFHYAPEIAAAFFWSLPALFTHFIPYFYVVFLTILLFDRAVRDDARCRTKYTKYWEIYCRRVPYRIIPLVY